MDARFAARLLRPHLDLGPFTSGPLHAQAVEECWHAFADAQRTAFAPQRALPPGFRVQLGAEPWGAAYAMADPRELPQALRSTRWQQMCAALAEAPSLPPERRCRLAALLHALGLYRPLLALAPPGAPIDGAGPREAEMAWWCASARYMLGLPARIGDYDDANLSGFVDLARCPSAPGLVRFNAAALIFVHLAKTGADAGELAGWAGPLELALANAVGEADPFNAVLITSRCWRALALLPQRVGDRAEMQRLMDLAQQQALALQPADAAQQHLYRENLHALWESRSKEALWLGDDERALACSRAVIEVDPYDAKAWVELGQIHFRSHRWREAARAYGTAALLGPPASAAARHLCGICLKECGEELLGALFFKDALELDPLGVSPREAIHALPDSGVLQGLRDWSRLSQRL